MKFNCIVEKLQNENPESIILMKNGIFFIALGKDAIVLNEQIGLKLTCMKEKLCKVGFLVKSVEKYIKILKQKDLSFDIYTIDKSTMQPEKLYSNKGKTVMEKRTCLDCENCIQRKDSEEEIIEKLKNLT